MPAAGASKPWAVQRGLRAGPLRRHETRLRKELVTDALAYGGVPELLGLGVERNPDAVAEFRRGGAQGHARGVTLTP